MVEAVFISAHCGTWGNSCIRVLHYVGFYITSVSDQGIDRKGYGINEMNNTRSAGPDDLGTKSTKTVQRLNSYDSSVDQLLKAALVAR